MNTRCSETSLRPRVEPRLAAVAALLLGCGAAGAAGGEATARSASNGLAGDPSATYRLRLQPSLGTAMRMRLRTAYNINGIGGPAAEFSFVQRIVGVSNAGLLEVQSRCELMRRLAPEPSDGPCSPPSIRLLDERGRPASTAEGTATNTQPVFELYPEAPVAIGDAWQGTLRWNPNGGTDRYTVDAAYTLVSVEPRGDELHAHIRLAGTLAVVDERPVAETERGGGRGSVEGDFFVRLSDGWLVDMRFDMDFEIAVPVSEGGGTARASARAAATAEPVP